MDAKIERLNHKTAKRATILDHKKKRAEELKDEARSACGTLLSPIDV